MYQYHHFLQKQLERYLEPEQINELTPFLEAIERTYRSHDEELRKANQSSELNKSELRIATTEFKAVLDAFPDQFIWLDKSGKVIRVQGNSLDSSISEGKFFWDTSEENVRRLRRQAFERVWKKEVTVEYTNPGSDSQHLEARIFPVVNGRMIAIIRDITDMKNLHTTLTKARDAAEQADRTKSEFLAVMSHELRTPLNAIIGMSDLLDDTGLSEEQSKIGKTIRESGTILLSIINDVLDYSKIESGELKTESIAYNLKDLLTETLDVVSPLAKFKNLDAELKVSADLPEMVIGDPLRTKQILMNLTSNAIKFTGEGQITIDCDTSLDSNAIRIIRFQIQDTGIGMAEDEVARLFMPFSQADSTITRRFGGTGLGLAISKQLADAMGGSISVESEVNKGSCFTLQLPLVEPSDEPDQHDPVVQTDNETDSSEIQGIKVLVVEDNEVNAQVAKAMLKKLNVQVVHVENGAIALNRIQQEEFDLVLMDCAMPVMDGFEATLNIRELPGAMSKIPIVALTANALAGDEERCKQAGMDGYITKPLKFATLQENLKQWVK